MKLRRRPFGELVDTQLELFERDHAGLLADCDVALRSYDASVAEEAEERYGEYVDLVDTVRDGLAELRDGYARGLDAATSEAYEAAFDDAARRRFPRYTLELE